MSFFTSQIVFTDESHELCSRVGFLIRPLTGLHQIEVDVVTVLPMKFPVTIPTEVNCEAVPVGHLPIPALEYVMILYVIKAPTGEAPVRSVSFHDALHRLAILSNSSGVSVSIPSSLASLTTPSRKCAICSESISELPTSLI